MIFRLAVGLLVVGAVQSSAQRAITTVYQKCHNQCVLRKFVQSAIDRYLGDDTSVQLSVDAVLNHFLGTSTTMLPNLDFYEYDDFVQWVSEQQRTILFLYESGDIACSVVHEYLIHRQQSVSVTIVQARMMDFILYVVGDIDELQVRDVVPQVLLIEDGHVYQLTLEEMLFDLKHIIDKFVN